VALQLGVGVIAIIVCGHQAYIDAGKNVTYIEPALRGIWSVQEFALDNNPRPPLVTDTQRWQRVIFDAPDTVTIQSMDGTLKKYYLQRDTQKNKLIFWDPPDTHWNASLTFDLARPDQITLDGRFGQSHVYADLKRVDMSDPVKFLLINRGVHWINQYPHNR